jgi:ribosomal protein RSM22 (predicted rRNA methylase)
MDMPGDLHEALSAELESVPAARLARATDALVARYRGDRPASSRQLVTSPEEVAAYAAYRLPATYAALVAVLTELSLRRPDLEPRTMLDVGAGPGTATWATRDVWPSLEHCQLLERDQRMISLGQRLAAGASDGAIRGACWRQVDLLSGWKADQHDLVVAGYVLNELPAERRADLVARLWELASGALVLVEPGTPAGFEIIRQARRQLIESGGTVLAPCPHDRACPMPETDWCHFARRINRTRLHRRLKRGDLSYEDEKFSYVAVSRQTGTPIESRVLRHPRILKGRVVLQLCAVDGLRESIVTRGKDKAGFRRARDLDWGDAIPADAEDWRSRG